MRSMTGCGTGQVLRGGWDITAELKTVNHRFLDVSMRLPRNIAFLEQPVRARIATVLRRGHVDVFLTVRNTETSSAALSVDLELAGQYANAAKDIAKATGAKNDVTVSTLMALDGVIQRNEPEQDQEAMTDVCLDALDIALAQVKDMREKEGKNLRDDLKSHLDSVAALRNKIEKRAPCVPEEYRQRLETRIQSLLSEPVDPQRIITEAALMADRCAVDEELARLKSHLDQMAGYLKAKEEIGKKMDFLIQEMNREANTIGSKASDAEITRDVVEMKSEIEKMREQIQNVE